MLCLCCQLHSATWKYIGIVPILSLLQTHVGQLLRLDAARFEQEKQEFHTLVTGLSVEKKDKKGPLISLTCGNCQAEDQGRSNKKLKIAAYFHIYKNFSLFFGTILGVLVVGT